MSLFKYALPVLAAAGYVQAQCSSEEPFVIENQSDAGSLSGCRTYRGSIEISERTTGTITIDGPQEIDGDLIANNVTGLNSLGSSSIKKISGEFGLNGNTQLSSLSFTQLTEVESIRWQTLPELRELRFDAEVTSAGSVDIRDTQLGTLDGINLEEVDTFYISNNRFIRLMELQLNNITTSLTIEANGNDLEVILPNLEFAANLTFRNVSSVSTPSLETVGGSMGFIGNSFESYAAPNLTDIGESLSFSDNPNLNNITLPELVSVGGGFLISKNPELKEINGIPKLESVGGALDFSGDFGSAELPALNDVQGAFNMQSTEDIQDTCGFFENIPQNEIQGEFTCVAQSDNPTDVDGNSSSDNGAADNEDAAISTRASMTLVFGIFGVMAATLGLF